MPTKHNKKRYQSSPGEHKTLTLTGNHLLRYRDDETGMQVGDVVFFPSVEALHTLHQGEYERTGYSGYFKVDVFDGKDWKPVVLQSLFEDRCHYFSKNERPLDVYVLCAERLAGLAGVQLKRTYREHYEIMDNQ